MCVCFPCPQSLSYLELALTRWIGLQDQDQGDEIDDGGSLLTYYDEDLVGMVGGEFSLLAWGLQFETRCGWTAFIRSSHIVHNTLRGRCVNGRRFCSALYTSRKLLRFVQRAGVVGRDLRSNA